MFLGFMLGLAAGVILMAAVQINHDNKIMEAYEKEYNSFTCDCLDDSSEDDHIPKIY